MHIRTPFTSNMSHTQIRSIHVPERTELGELPFPPTHGDPYDTTGLDACCSTAADDISLFLLNCIHLFSPERGLDGNGPLKTYTPGTKPYDYINKDIYRQGVKLACAHGHTDQVKYLVNGDGGAPDPAIRTHMTDAVIKQALTEGLQLAVRYGHTDLVDYLLSPALVDFVDTTANHCGAFMEACEQMRDDDTTMVQTLLRQKMVTTACLTFAKQRFEWLNSVIQSVHTEPVQSLPPRLVCDV